MIEIKPYKIYTTEPYFAFEVKGRGTLFCFFINENEHLNNVKLVGEEVLINGDIYLVKALEKVFRGDDGTNRRAYSVLVDKVQELFSDFEKRKQQQLVN